MKTKEILDALKAAGYTQEKIAHSLQITQSAISQWIKKESIPAQHIISLIDLSGAALCLDDFREVSEPSETTPLKNSENQLLSGSEILVKCLQNLDVQYLFGYPGGAVLPIYDALHTQDSIKHILVRHEQAAVHAADGYARTSGKVGCALVTSGPGLTNAVTGIATAHMDSIPLVVISGNVPSHLIGNDAFQEVDAVGITRSCVKHNFLLNSTKDIAQVVSKAFYIAKTGRPGPVHIDIPKDISVQTSIYVPSAKTPRIPSYQINMRGNERQIKKALELMKNAKKPIFYTGGGVILAEAVKELRTLVDCTGFPITNTLMGLGAYPSPNPKFLGMLGMHGTYEANLAMHGSDCIIAIGARFDDRITGETKKFSPNATIIHIDIDTTSISKNITAHVPIVGDSKIILKQMLELIDPKDYKDKKRTAQWWQQIEQWRAKKSLSYQDSSTVIKPQKVVETVYKITRGEAIVTSDVGQHQMWAAQHYHFKEPRQWINSGGLGTMGFGLPAAMGAKIACPNKEVVCITGEGSIQMMLQELSTMLQYHTPVKIVNLNNRYLGMVRQWQEFFYDRRYSMSYMDALPDFVKLAESFHHVGVQITDPNTLEAQLTEAFKIKEKTVFIDVLVDPEENVYPMIPSGGAHNEILLSTDAMQSVHEQGSKLV